MTNEQNLRPCEHKFTQEEVKKGAKKIGEIRWSDIEKNMYFLNIFLKKSALMQSSEQRAKFSDMTVKKYLRYL